MNGMVITVLLGCALLVACVDRTITQSAADDDPTWDNQYGTDPKGGEITCYAGNGTVVYQGASTGAIRHISQTDWIYWRDASNQRITRGNDNCIVTALP